MTRVICAAVAFTILFGSRSALAWEADLHFGLTKWLALKAGFTRPEAETIAQGDQGLDDSWVTAAIGASALSCRDDAQGATSVHDNHFASKIDAPDSPQSREVTAGQVWRGGHERPVPVSNLNNLGQYLHTLQDSWSHQHIPDIPPTCNEKYSWSHAEIRGGWACHLADLTYRWQRDVVATAKATYDVLLAQVPKGRQSAGWENLQGAVEDFAKANSKWAKHEWFRREWASEAWFLDGPESSHLQFIETVSLPDCESRDDCRPYAFNAIVNHAKHIGGKVQTVGDIPRGVLDLAAQAFRLIRKEATGEFMSLLDNSLAANMLRDGLNISERCDSLLSVAVPLMLTKGLLRGDGARQPIALCELALDHRRNGRPLSCSEALRGLREALDNPLRTGPTLEEANKLMDGPEFDYEVSRSMTGDSFKAKARFKHVINDELHLEIRSIKNAWRITGFAWMPRQ
jgi:hypothetical protein